MRCATGTPQCNLFYFMLQMNQMDSQQSAFNLESKNDCQGYRSDLYHQAYEYGKRGQFERAQQHIRQAICQYPINIQGYLLCGELYSQQGKQQMAVDIYEQGIHATEHESERQILRNQQILAKTRQEARIDFVHTLFPDVIAAIFEHVGELDKARVMHVSKTWRHFVLQLPFLWRSAYCWVPFSINPTFRLLHTVSDYVHNIKLTGVSDKISKELLSLAQNGRLSRVNRVELKTFEDLRIDLSFVFSLGQNLSNLIINESSQNNTGSEFPLDLILSKCQSLLLLSLITMRSISFDDANTTPLKLHTLIIGCSGSNNRAFQSILQRSPHLRQFGTPNGCSTETLLVLDQHCPYLNALHITPNLDEIDILEKFNDTYGLDILAVDDRNIFGPRDLLPFFSKSRTSLRSLILELSYTRRISAQEWTPLATLGPFPNMKYICFSSNDRTASTEHTAIPLMLQCPALESVVFDYIDMVSDLTVDALMILSRLKELKIAHSDMSSNIQQFFQRHAELGNASSLKRVVITYGHPLTDSILIALADITTLQYINIRGSEDITKSGLDTFISKYSSHSDVGNLRFSDLRQVTGPEISNLLRSRTI